MKINTLNRIEIIKKYIDEFIMPQYIDDNSGHGIDHIQSVITRSLFLVDEFHLNVDKVLVYIIAAYHDIGYKIDRENHEKISANMFLEDQYLISNLTADEMQIITEAIEDHRSKKKTTPRNIYGKLLCDADRQMDIDDIIKRVFKYIKKYYHPKDIEDQINRTYNFIKNKNSDKDRVKFYFQHKSDIDTENKLLKLIDNEKLFKEKIKKLHAIS